MANKEGADDTNVGDEESPVELRLNEYPFMDSHPGYEFSHLEKRKHEVMPVISLPAGSICRIKDLEMCSSEPFTSALEKRERYARTALIMFQDFCSLADLQCADSILSIYWTKFMKV